MITFIIPTIGRDTLKRSIKSIEDQTSDQWKVIVIFDGVKSTINNSNSKIKIFEIEKKGESKNSAGNVRNYGMKFVDTDWIAFLDDDDVISPNFVETFNKELNDYPFFDILIFRMAYNNTNNIFPKLKTDNFYKNNVGISFVINKNIINNIQFYPSSTEDYNFLNDARNKNYIIMISPYIKYFVNGYVNKNKSDLLGNRVIINDKNYESFKNKNNNYKYFYLTIILYLLLIIFYTIFL